MNKLLPACMALLLLAACTAEEKAPESHDETTPAGPTNRIDIPPEVVQNLGITFAKVERRHVDRTLRFPGAFELPASSEREYRAPVAGRVSLLVSQYGHVKTGDVIATIDSPQWRDMQQELGNLEAAADSSEAEHALATAERAAAEADIAMYPRRIESYGPRLEALEAHHRNLEASRALWQERLTTLEELAAKGAGKASEIAEARGSLAKAVENLSSEEETHADLYREIEMLKLAQETATNHLPVLAAAEKAAAARATSARAAYELRLRGTATTLGVAPEALTDDAWRTLDRVSVTANATGMVMDLHVRESELLAEGDSLCLVVDNGKLRFRAHALQADIGRLKDGLTGRVVPPVGGTLDSAAGAEGVILIAPMADADTRTVEVVMNVQSAPSWARPGVTAELEVVWDATDEPKLAVPSRALIRDGLEVLFFVRDMADANKVIRIVAETGPSDGRWTVVYHGVMEGSEVVLDGTYELKLTGGGKSTLKGHFHADGTFHAEGTPEPGG